MKSSTCALLLTVRVFTAHISMTLRSICVVSFSSLFIS